MSDESVFPFLSGSDARLAADSARAYLASLPDALERISAAYEETGTDLGDGTYSDALWEALIAEVAIGASRLADRRLPEDPEFWRWIVPLAAGVFSVDVARRRLG